ncbi:GM24272 [Drosophila sechellia]|uniref:GM24272 n=1 Tax=Drosophila sechellia TaxID=7238 RepID=B4HLF9_DROSE|nr:GM24272 [Drosophila sechellia]
MFSGLTNQFTSLVGAVKGGAGDEDVPAPTGDAPAAAPAASTSVEATASSAVDPEAAAAAGGEGLEGEEAGKRLPKSASLVDSLVSEATGGEDDAKSRYISATEGADSHPASGGGTPTGDEGQIGQGKGDEVKTNEVATKEKKSKTAEPAKGDSSVKAIAEQPKAVIEPEAQECDVQAAKSKAKAQAGKELGQKISESEFVSDDFQASSESDLAEIQDGMRKLGIDSMTQQALAPTDEEQWEKDLEAELKDYEVVDEGGTGGGGRRKGRKAGEDDTEADEDEPTISNLRTRSTNNDWEEYADLIEDTDDLK